MSEARPWHRFWPEDVPRHIDYPEVPLFELLAGRARSSPDNVAFTCRGQSLTYRELDTLTARFAVGLHRLGIGSNSRLDTTVVGDTVNVSVRIVEGEKERVQIFAG